LIENRVVISVASGKGGTGKTTIAVSLFSVLPDSVYLDCDVEEPNGYLFVKPEIMTEEYVYKIYPAIDVNKCNFCGKCVEVCESNSLVNLSFDIVLYEEMCSSCGACLYFCPLKIIEPKPKDIGIVRKGATAKSVNFIDGFLNIGEMSAVPLIKKVKEQINRRKIYIIDSPPGTSCSMIEAVKDSDYCILVTESSPFGLSDLKIAVEVIRLAKIPFGVVINKYESEYTELEEYLKYEQIELLLKVSFDKKYAESYSKGILPVKKYPELLEGYKRMAGYVIKSAVTGEK
jgi:MinD superfamily P-loop ATPase